MVSPPEQIPARRAHHNTPGTRVTVREVIILPRGQPSNLFRRIGHSPQQPQFCIGPVPRLLHRSISTPCFVQPIFGKRTLHQFCHHDPIQSPLKHALSGITIQHAAALVEVYSAMDPRNSSVDRIQVQFHPDLGRGSVDADNTSGIVC